MKQQQIRTRLMTLILAGVAGAGIAATAMAAGVGGVGGGANAGVGAGVTMPGTAQAGGTADTHMSTSGAANSNAQWQNGATRGADRAAERKGAEMPQSDGADLEAAGTTTTKGKSKH